MPDPTTDVPTDLDVILTAETIANRLGDEARALAARLRAMRANPAQLPDDNSERVELGIDIETLKYIADELANPAFHFHGMSD